MKLYTAVALAVALAFAGGALGTGAVQNTNYTTAGIALTGIWCKAGGHNYTPLGDPEDYGDTSDPVNDPIGFFDAHDAWAWSGEPECAPTDVAFGTEDDSGIMAAAFCVGGTLNGEACGDHLGHDFQVSSNDLVGLPNLFVWADACPAGVTDCSTQDETEDVTSQGCGASGITIPTNYARHWQSPISQPTYLLWVLIDGAFVDASTGGVCLGATGTVTAEF